MKKVNKKGFVLAETIAISVVVITALVIIYAQFVSVDNSYYRTYKYNNVNDLYLVGQIKQFIGNDSSIYSNINDETLYLDITSCPTSYIIEFMHCDSLIDAIDAKTVIITKNDTTDLYNNINKYNFSETMKTFIKNSKTKQDGYRIIVEFESGNIASLTVDNTLVYNYENIKERVIG